jgi:hypothetical protein
MTSKNTLRGILSLSAASMALLQSSISAKGEPTTETTGEPNGVSNDQITSKTDKLILEPPHQSELLRLYADHSSHASHSSHVSGAGVGSYDSTPVTPYYPPSTPAVTPQPAPTPTVPAYTNSSAQAFLNTPADTSLVPTNAVSTTNAPIGEVVINTAHIDDLTKQAAAGSSYAQYSLGICYLYGSDGAKKNTEKAKMLLELAAVQGNAFAKERLEELNQSEKAPETSEK